MKTANAQLPADQVLVTVGTVAGVSAVGTVETQRALLRSDPRMIGLAAYDAGLVDVELCSEEPVFVARSGPQRGQRIELDDIERRWGAQLRANMGIRRLEMPHAHLPCDIGAMLPHDLERGGLRDLSGVTFEAMRASGLRDMATLFHDDPRLGPSLQAQLFLYGGLSALAALPGALAELLPEAHRFRVAAGCAFPGLEHVHHLAQGMQPGATQGTKGDRLAYRLSSSLNTHGPALINALLSPAYNLTKVRKHPELLQGLVHPGTGLCNVPQAPLVASGACASALLALSDVAPQLLSRGMGHAPELVLWTAADAPLQPDGRVIEGFGPEALLSSRKLAELNLGRGAGERRAIGEALAPFDEDAAGTVLGHAGSGVVITTLRFAVEHGLDVTSLIVGVGQSGETGGKGHFAGVGFGGENALILALRAARQLHGYGVGDFGHLVAHATGTRTNSRTDLVTVARACRAVQAEQAGTRRGPRLTVGAPKALGDGHTMGEAGLRSTAEAIYYVLGEPTAGVPSLRRPDPALAEYLEHVSLGTGPVAGDEDGGALVYAQGFGGYVAAVALRAAHADALRRYSFPDPAKLDAYLERRDEVRRKRVHDERAVRLARGALLPLIERHRWV